MRNQENTIDLCLSAEEMKAYLAESLSKEDAGLIDTHLADCELCCDSLEALTELGAELDLTMTEATFIENAIMIVMALLMLIGIN